MGASGRGELGKRRGRVGTKKGFEVMTKKRVKKQGGLRENTLLKSNWVKFDSRYGRKYVIGRRSMQKGRKKRM